MLPATLGVSAKLSLEVNSVAVARTAGESIGGIMTLSHSDGREMTVNVEYAAALTPPREPPPRAGGPAPRRAIARRARARCADGVRGARGVRARPPRRYNQIDALLKATVEPRGDVAGADGYSPYPGSINQLLFAMKPYAANLARTGGAMPEFVNPKYTDGTKTAFKAPTRLECMMQDYPKALGPRANVRSHPHPHPHPNPHPNPNRRRSARTRTSACRSCSNAHTPCVPARMCIPHVHGTGMARARRSASRSCAARSPSRR